MTKPNHLGAAAPVDALHDECVQTRAALRAEYRLLQARAAEWEPRPCPTVWSNS